MEPLVLAKLTAGFVEGAGKVLAEIQKEDLAFLQLKKISIAMDRLKERYEDFKGKLDDAVLQLKSEKRQDLINRGMSNTSVADSFISAIDRDAGKELVEATREFNRTREELALREQEIRIRNRSVWTRFCLWLCRPFGS
jgi:hypothetical protein